MKVQWVSLLNFMGGGGVASGPCPVLPGCRHWLPVVFSFLFAIEQYPVCAKKKKKLSWRGEDKVEVHYNIQSVEL
jgi:hypothetical protein